MYIHLKGDLLRASNFAKANLTTYKMNWGDRCESFVATVQPTFLTSVVLAFLEMAE